MTYIILYTGTNACCKNGVGRECTTPVNVANRNNYISPLSF
jgi:hypothetical protein